MLILQYTLLLLSAMSILIAMRLIWAWSKLRFHPHVEPLATAEPQICDALESLVEHVANHAKIEPPEILIRRAALPNAFIAASCLRPEMYLTDELLECCTDIQHLERVICHEIAHIRRGDSVPLGLLTWALQWSQIFHIKPVSTWLEARIASIELATDKEAEIYFKKLSQT